ncbi:uncharacterized PE-PGRS family protein PE_PGRS54-like [Maniola jurtina]|uniref:uncharacterized PE-PGRS family protein PE_PGRS54-like n=1 Tax=Maniola jurtina TaxID=191418 RepID=UPI001E68CDD4|nr:uncharacterized PE-PGRS family protein PE_PGRS54-like [Maniola jurtina]
MKFTVFIVLLTISTTWGIKSKKEEPKDKREAAGTYLPQSSQNYQSPSSGQEEANAISIGAGYSIGGGAKPTYSFGGQSAGVGASYQLQPESGHSNIQLAPISFQQANGGLVSNDLSQLMSQISHGLNSGAISLPSSGGQGALYQFAGQGGQGGQEISLPQFSYGSPQLQQYSLGDQGQGSLPTYALGTKGLGTFKSTGPVLFSPESSGNQGALSYAAPSFGQSYQAAALPLGDSGHSFPGFSFGGSGQSLGGSLKAFSGNYAIPAGQSSFKPSAFLGASVQSDSGAGLAGLSGSYGSPSFAAYQQSAGGHGVSSLGSGGHGASFGSLSGYSGGPSKAIAASYLPSKYEGVGSLESIASAFSASGQIGAPGSTYGSPSSAYSSNAHAASAPSPAYYISSGKHSSPSFGLGSSSFRGPVSGHSSLNSFSSGPKYSFGGGHGSSRYAPAKDVQGSYSESNYNTIKYSSELKPRFN